MKYKYMMYNCDELKFQVIPRVKLVDAIYYAWNYEFDTYNRETEEIILCCWDDNEFNCELLKPYGLRLIDSDGYRKLQDINTGEIYSASWE